VSTPTNDAVMGTFVSRGDDFLQLKNAAGSVLAGINSTGTGYGNLAGGGGGGTPGGAPGELQYNNSGSFGGVTGSSVDANGNITIKPNATGNAITVQQFDGSSLALNCTDGAGGLVTVYVFNGGSGITGTDAANDTYAFFALSGTVEFQMVDSSNGNIDFKSIGGTTSIQLTDSSSATIFLSPSLVGFFSAAPVGKQTVTGVKLPSDVVMASLLTALANLGLITDSTT
jgi:hypothetical protein